MERLDQYCQYLAWDAVTLSHEARISIETARKLLDGKGASNRIKRIVTDNLNRTMNTQLQPGQIIWEWKEE